MDRTLYQIDRNLMELLENGFNLDCIDLETGEIDEAKLIELLNEYQAEREAKLEAVALFIRSLSDEIEASKKYEKDLADRRKRTEAKAESLKRYLTKSITAFGSTSFKSVKVSASVRKSTAVDLDENRLPNEWWRVTEIRKPDKTAIGTALKAGQEVEGAWLVENQNITIK